MRNIKRKQFTDMFYLKNSSTNKKSLSLWFEKHNCAKFGKFRRKNKIKIKLLVPFGQRNMLSRNYTCKNIKKIITKVGTHLKLTNPKIITLPLSKPNEKTWKGKFNNENVKTDNSEEERRWDIPDSRNNCNISFHNVNKSPRNSVLHIIAETKQDQLKTSAKKI